MRYLLVNLKHKSPKSKNEGVKHEESAPHHDINLPKVDSLAASNILAWDDISCGYAMLIRTQSFPAA
jgi:hypothetical protein